MESIWQDFPMTRFPRLSADTKTDVLIIGGGMAGLLTAHCLNAAGIRCIVAEASTIGSGTTKNTTAKVTAQHGLIYHRLIDKFGPEAARLYLQANLEAVDALRSLALEAGCWENQSSYVYSTENPTLLEREFRALESIRYPARWEDSLSLPFPTAGAVCFPDQGQIHPMKLLEHLSRGLQIYENTRIHELKPGYATADGGRIFANSFIVATHFPFLNLHGCYFLKLYQHRSYVLALENAPVPEGMYLAAEENGLSIRHAGNTLLLGGGGHRTGKQGGWETPEQCAEEFYPGARIVRRWASQDCMTLDSMPYIGLYSKNTPNVYVATGFNKWGMTGAMTAAQLLTDRIRREPNPWDELFSPSRSMLHKQLGINLLESAWNLLTPTAPRCPHMGCALKWNPREHSWDCPCHGSRFSEDGKLMDNPATGDLKKRK